MALNKGIWDPKLRGTNINGTNLKSVIEWSSQLSCWESLKEALSRESVISSPNTGPQYGP